MEGDSTDSLISEKTINFAVRIVRFYKYLCEEKKEYILSKQILRSGTSIGANVRESRNAQSRADFIRKLNIALKEADETNYWLRLLSASEYVSEGQVGLVLNECNEIISILVSIVRNSKLNSQDK